MASLGSWPALRLGERLNDYSAVVGVPSARQKIALTPLTGQPLAVPPLYPGDMVAGVRQFELYCEPSAHELFAGMVTNTWAVNHASSQLPMLGPMLALRRGESVSIRYHNNLPETTTMHGHGMAVPGPADGGPHQRIAPGDSWTASYTVDQPACTNWYHPHEEGRTAPHVYYGLAGMIRLDDDQTDALGLPQTHGFDDIPLVIQDRVFDDDGQFLYAPTSQEIRMGYFGDYILTNGQIEPVLNVPRGWVRFRLLNASNSEIWRFYFDDDRRFIVIAGDNGLLPKPVDARMLTLSPAERAEILVDCSRWYSEHFDLRATGIRGGLQQRVLSIRVENGAGLVRNPPVSWPEDDFQPAGSAPLRTFDLGGQGGLRINGRLMDMNYINEQVPLNQTEFWRVRSTNGMMHHNFHVHGGGFRILSRDGSSKNLQPHERGEKDVVYLPPGSEVLLQVRFLHPAGSQNPFMYHCHFLEHEDAGMMGQFTVT